MSRQLWCTCLLILALGSLSPGYAEENDRDKILFAITRKSSYTSWECAQTRDKMPLFLLYRSGRYFVRRDFPSDTSCPWEIATGALTMETLEKWTRRLFELHAYLWGMPKVVDYRATHGTDWYFYFGQFKNPDAVHVYNLILPEDADDPETTATSTEAKLFRDLVRDVLALGGSIYSPDHITVAVGIAATREELNTDEEGVPVPAWLERLMSREMPQWREGRFVLREIPFAGQEARLIYDYFKRHSLSITFELDGVLARATVRIELPGYQDHLRWLRQHYHWDSRFDNPRVITVHSHDPRVTPPYDAASQLTRVTHTRQSDGTLLQEFTYTYDLSGNRSTQASLAGTDTYTYDALNRLTAATHPTQPHEAYTYDPVGNRTSSHLSATPTYDAANRLLSDDHFTDTYDANGNLTSKTDRSTGEVTTFTYDPEDQLIGVTKARPPFAPTLLVSYHYDGLGRRWAKRVNGTPIAFMYDGEDVVRLLDRTRRHLAEIHHGPGIDEPLLLRDPATGERFTYLADGLGSVIMLVRPDGSVAQTYLYDSFGRIVAQAGVVNQPFTFTGREFDAETGLYFYRNRYLDPQTGRFIQADPLGGINLYWYADANPVNNTDPFGLYVSPELQRRFPGITSTLDLIRVALKGDVDRFDPQTRERLLAMFEQLVTNPLEPTVKLAPTPKRAPAALAFFDPFQPNRINITPEGLAQAQKGWLTISATGGFGRFRAPPEEIVAFLLLHEFFHLYLTRIDNPAKSNNFVVNQITESYFPQFRGGALVKRCGNFFEYPLVRGHAARCPSSS